MTEPEVKNISVDTRLFLSKDYDVISAWWKARNWPVIPPRSLPKLGLIASFEDQPICAGFIYETDSNFCLFEWIISNPEASSYVRGLCLDALFQDAEFLGKELGFHHMITMTSHEKLIERAKKFGFKVTDEHVTHLVKEL